MYLTTLSNTFQKLYWALSLDTCNTQCLLKHINQHSNYDPKTAALKMNTVDSSQFHFGLKSLDLGFTLFTHILQLGTSLARISGAVSITL